MQQNSVCVIICTRNRVDDLRHCLGSLRVQTRKADEIIIVDSSDRATNEEDVRDLFGELHVISRCLYVHTQPGLTYQRNVGIDRAISDLLFFFDDDVVLESDYLAQMVAIFDMSTHIGGGMGAVTNIPAKVDGWQRWLRTVFLLQRDYSSGRFTWSGMPTHAYGTIEFKYVEVLGGCCMAFRRDLIARHKFDEQLTHYAYMEDCDASRRVSLQAPLFYQPAARLQHFNSPLARDRVVDNRAMFIKNYSYLFFKNFYPRNKLRIVAYAWSVVGLFVEAILIRNRDYIKGYMQGLKQFYTSRSV